MNLIVVLYGTCVRACVWRWWWAWVGGVGSECVRARKIQTNVLSCSGVKRGTQRVMEKKELDISWFINIYFLENDIVLV